ncbi:hypothetical protein PFISCL1PPCAC_19677, partial [Pristionchus fissidentatus]
TVSSSLNSSQESFVGPSTSLMILHNSSVILLTILSNLLLISAVFRSNRIKRRRRVTPVQVLMLHMTLSDILFAILTIFPNLLTLITLPVFHGPDSLCRFVKFLQILLQVVPLYASAFLLVAISADRYYAICRPLDSIKMGVYNRPSLYAIIAWSLALLFSTPQLFLFYKDEESHECLAYYAKPWMYTVYVCCFNTAVWLLPSALAGAFYTCVCRAVWDSLAIRNMRDRNKER